MEGQLCLQRRPRQQRSKAQVTHFKGMGREESCLIASCGEKAARKAEGEREIALGVVAS